VGSIWQRDKTGLWATIPKPGINNMRNQTAGSRNSMAGSSSGTRSMPTTPIIHQQYRLHVQHPSVDPHYDVEQASAPVAQAMTYKAPWPMYACSWQPGGTDRLAVASHLEDANNRLALLHFDRTQKTPITRTADLAIHFPPTKVAFEPNGAMLATTSDQLRLYATVDNIIEPITTLTNAKNDFCSPLTSFDWNQVSSNLIITSSIDTTCTIWDLQARQAKTQLIAHDKEVFDVQFSAGSDVCFCSVGADGSVRVFDTRSLEHSTIVYESSRPLLRISANSRDANLFATFSADSSNVSVIDIRRPGAALEQLDAHAANVNAIQWMPNSRNVLASIGDDAQVLVWDLAAEEGNVSPIMMWKGSSQGNNLCWDHRGDFVAVVVGKGLHAVKA